MADIQVDMFEVQLGAGMLIQLSLPDGEVVRILADAGVKAAGYSSDHVLKKLPACFQAFSPTLRQAVHLMVGTHYDEDHLEGLVDVASDITIDIFEAWLPPIANDVSRGPADSYITDSDLLAEQFSSERGAEVFAEYIQAHAERCEEARHAGVRILESARESGAFDFDTWKDLRDEVPRWDDGTVGELLWERTRWADGLRELVPDNLDEVQKYFRDHVQSADAVLPKNLRGGHADEAMEDIDSRDISPFFFGYDLPYRPWQYDEIDLVNATMRASPSHARQLFTRAALIRKSTARNAINATSLNKLVGALKARNVPIRSLCIDAGQPRFFRWGASNRPSFGEISAPTYQASLEPKITLLGPSQQLVKKHRDKLPIGTYAAAMLTRIPIKSITPSNQLSYVFKLGFNDQKILIAGDAGCVDFKPSGNSPYFPALLGALDQLHVVQVAHHAGNNAHFYRVLLKSGYATNTSNRSFLMLSHATQDRHRPTPEFQRFVEQLENNRLSFKLLFTSEPNAAKVKPYRHLAYSVIGRSHTCGDVRLTCDAKTWQVDRHAIRL